MLKKFSSWAGFDILVGFDILAKIYAAHAINWQLLEGHIDKHCWLPCWLAFPVPDWEYNEKKDVQKLNKHVKSKSVMGKKSIKKIKAL